MNFGGFMKRLLMFVLLTLGLINSVYAQNTINRFYEARPKVLALCNMEEDELMGVTDEIIEFIKNKHPINRLDRNNAFETLYAVKMITGTEASCDKILTSLAIYMVTVKDSNYPMSVYYTIKEFNSK